MGKSPALQGCRGRRACSRAVRLLRRKTSSRKKLPHQRAPRLGFSSSKPSAKNQKWRKHKTNEGSAQRTRSQNDSFRDWFGFGPRGQTAGVSGVTGVAPVCPQESRTRRGCPCAAPVRAVPSSPGGAGGHGRVNGSVLTGRGQAWKDLDATSCPDPRASSSEVLEEPVPLQQARSPGLSGSWWGRPGACRGHGSGRGHLGPQGSGEPPALQEPGLGQMERESASFSGLASGHCGGEVSGRHPPLGS